MAIIKIFISYVVPIFWGFSDPGTFLEVTSAPSILPLVQGPLFLSSGTQVPEWFLIASVDSESFTPVGLEAAENFLCEVETIQNSRFGEVPLADWSLVHTFPKKPVGDWLLFLIDNQSEDISCSSTHEKPYLFYKGLDLKPHYLFGNFDLQNK